MIRFDNIRINQDKAPADNIRIIKDYMDDCVFLLNKLSAEVEDLKNKIESEEK